MLEYDEYGRPLPPKDPYLDMMAKPFETTAANPATPHVYGGNRARSTNPILAENGINTEGPLAEQAAQNAQQYRAGVDQYENATGQGRPQVYGQQEPMGQDQGPLSPQETAERMPQTSGAMEELVRKHLIPMNPALKKLSKEGYQNHLTAKREAEANEKQQRMQQMAGRGDATSFMGGEGGPSVQRIGGFAFVKGRWRPQTPEEQAQTGFMQARTQNEQAKPMLEMADIASRGQIARSNQDFRAKESEANRGIQKERIGETKRHNTALEANASADDAAKLAAQAEKDLEAARSELDDLTAQLRERSGSAEQRSKGYLWNSNPDQYLDDERSKKDPDKFIKEPGSFASRAQRAAMLLTKLEDALKAKKYTGYIPDDQYEFLDNLRKKYPSTKQF